MLTVSVSAQSTASTVIHPGCWRAVVGSGVDMAQTRPVPPVLEVAMAPRDPQYQIARTIQPSPASLQNRIDRGLGHSVRVAVRPRSSHVRLASGDRSPELPEAPMMSISTRATPRRARMMAAVIALGCVAVARPHGRNSRPRRSPTTRPPTTSAAAPATAGIGRARSCSSRAAARRSRCATRRRFRATQARSAANMTESLTSDYTISFTVTAPGAYYFDVGTEILGQLDVVYDGGLTGGSADISAVTGSQTGGTAVLSGNSEPRRSGQLLDRRQLGDELSPARSTRSARRASSASATARRSPTRCASSSRRARSAPPPRDTRPPCGSASSRATAPMARASIPATTAAT